jgi:hypothetical protein
MDSGPKSKDLGGMLCIFMGTSGVYRIDAPLEKKQIAHSFGGTPTAKRGTPTAKRGTPTANMFSRRKTGEPRQQNGVTPTAKPQISSMAVQGALEMELSAVLGRKKTPSGCSF